MASCMVLYASGEVQVAEAPAQAERGAWFCCSEFNGMVEVRFGQVILGYEGTTRVRWDADHTVADILDEWADANDVLAVQVNGVTVWPPEPLGGGA